MSREQSQSALLDAYTKELVTTINKKLIGDACAWDVNPSTVKIAIYHHSAKHRSNIVKGIDKIISKIFGGVSPVSAAKLDVNDNMITVNLSLHSLHEQLNENAILDHILAGLVKGFKAAEEAYSEENSERIIYTLSTLKSDEDGKKVAIVLQKQYLAAARSGQLHSSFMRLYDYAEEYLEQEAQFFGIKLSQHQTIMKYTLILEMS